MCPLIPGIRPYCSDAGETASDSGVLTNEPLSTFPAQTSNSVEIVQYSIFAMMILNALVCLFLK